MKTELFIKLHQLLQEERRLQKQDTPSVKLGTLTFKHITIRYRTKGGEEKTYNYVHPYIRIGKKQRHVKAEELDQIYSLTAVREQLKLVALAIRSLVRLLFSTMPVTRQLSEAALRKIYHLAARESEKHRNAKQTPTGNERYRSIQGDWMNSRAECLAADQLYFMGLPYKYEPKVSTPGGEYDYRQPDFEIFTLNQTYYMELMGMVDDPEYEIGIGEKLHDYQINGIESGKNLLLFRNRQRYGIDGRQLWDTLQATVTGELPKGMVYI